jgi:hypothetical protein
MARTPKTNVSPDGRSDRSRTLSSRRSATPPPERAAPEAQRAYRAVGFVPEGVLRDAVLTNGEYESLIVMSTLEGEWAGLARSPSPE